MKIKIQMPLGVNNIGKRDNNEDSLYPLPGNVSTNDNLFLVCDGVGGSARGEIASRTVAQRSAEFFRENDINMSLEENIKQMVSYAEKGID